VRDGHAGRGAAAAGAGERWAGDVREGALMTMKDPNADPKRRGWILTDVHRRFIVERLACFMGPGHVANAVRDELGIEITRQGIQRYDPTRVQGKKGNLAKRWVLLFEFTRKAFLEHIESAIPEANKAVRVRDLAEAARLFKERGNYHAMADMHERIAKEMGNVHTNRREWTGKDAGPIQFEDLTQRTDDDLRAELAQLLGGTAHDAAAEPTKH
jgi:hypothetical protein